MSIDDDTVVDVKRVVELYARRSYTQGIMHCGRMVIFNADVRFFAFYVELLIANFLFLSYTTLYNFYSNLRCNSKHSI